MVLLPLKLHFLKLHTNNTKRKSNQPNPIIILDVVVIYIFCIANFAQAYILSEIQCPVNANSPIKMVQN